MFRLGRKAVKRDTRTLRLARYMRDLAPPPAAVRWDKGITSWGMMLNDSLGDCTIAGVGHAIQVWKANAGVTVKVPDAVVERYYSAWDGYVPGNPSTDNGGIELDVLTRWKANGFNGHRLAAFADPNLANLAQVKLAIALFQGLYIGLTVTDRVMKSNANSALPWSSQPGDVAAGGHCVYVVGYDANYVYLISWGSVYKMTWSYWGRWVDEAHALVSPDLLTSAGVSASGFNTTQLLADLEAIT